jgi:hypothetical protein
VFLLGHCWLEDRPFSTVDLPQNLLLINLLHQIENALTFDDLILYFGFVLQVNRVFRQTRPLEIFHNDLTLLTIDIRRSLQLILVALGGRRHNWRLTIN